MVGAMEKELRLQKEAGFLPNNARVGSVYFGGGTPSLLGGTEVGRLIDRAGTYFELSEVKEITLEANPDDLTADKLRELRYSGINRFSIGVQSFFDEDLHWMNRAHRAQEAESAIKRAQDAGFPNLTVDLIYGYPLLSDTKWDTNIGKLLNFEVPHISAYSMTVEPRTTLGTLVRKGQEPAMDEEQSARQFEYLMDRLAGAGYHHYEISNWARAGSEAIHNSSYWKGQPYLGIGPSAHSYNIEHRQWNIANNARYMRAIADENAIPFERETLTDEDRINEYMMTSLRTSEGLDLNRIRSQFGVQVAAKLAVDLSPFEQQDLVFRKADRFLLTRAGKLLADRIAAELFV